MRVGIALTVILAPPAPAAAQRERPAVMVSAVRNDLDDAARVGPKRTGMICGPAGQVVWKDARPDPLDTADAIVRALQAQGIRAFAYDRHMEDGAAPYVVTAVITAARISACMPQRGVSLLVGGRRTLKVDGSIGVRWTVRTPDAARRQTVDDEQPLGDGGEAKSLPTAVQNAVAASAGRLVPIFAASAVP